MKRKTASALIAALVAGMPLLQDRPVIKKAGRSKEEVDIRLRKAQQRREMRMAKRRALKK